jgi:hypothetical protein
MPGNKTITIKSGTGTVFNYSLPDAVDDVSDATVSCSPTTGSFFEIGTTTVTCTATDAAGNVGTDTFKVTVKKK